MAVLRLSGPQILTLSDLAQQGFDPKSFDGLDRETSHYASGDDNFPTSLLRTLEREHRNSSGACRATKRQRHKRTVERWFRASRAPSPTSPQCISYDRDNCIEDASIRCENIIFT